MRDIDLFRMALGIEPPWVVAKSDFDATAKRLDIYLDFARGSRFACPECGIAGCPAHDSEDKTWRHLNFFQHEAYLHARVPRVTCKSCGIKQVSVPWARPDSGFTLLFEALVMAMVQAMPVAVVARMVEEWDTRLWRLIHHYVEAARHRADHSEVTSVAFDETASRRGHNYVSLFVDLVRRRVLFVAEGKSLPSRRRGTPARSMPSPRACPRESGGPGGPWRKSRGRRRGVHRHEPGLHCRHRGKPAQCPDHLRQIPRRQAHQRGR